METVFGFFAVLLFLIGTTTAVVLAVSVFGAVCTAADNFVGGLLEKTNSANRKRNENGN